MGLQRVGHDWVTELNWTEYGKYYFWLFSHFFFFSRQKLKISVQFSLSVISDSLQPMDCNTPGLPVHHQLREPTESWLREPTESLAECLSNLPRSQLIIAMARVELSFDSFLVLFLHWDILGCVCVCVWLCSIGFSTLCPMAATLSYQPHHLRQCSKNSTHLLLSTFDYRLTKWPTWLQYDQILIRILFMWVKRVSFLFFDIVLKLTFLTEKILGKIALYVYQNTVC